MSNVIAGLTRNPLQRIEIMTSEEIKNYKL